MLKKIEAIIREDKVNDVKDALSEIGIVGLNIFEIRGHGRQGGIKLAGRSGTYMVDMLPKIQVNIVLSDRNLEAAIEAMPSACCSARSRMCRPLRKKYCIRLWLRLWLGWAA